MQEEFPHSLVSRFTSIHAAILHNQRHHGNPVPSFDLLVLVYNWTDTLGHCQGNDANVVDDNEG